MICALFCCLFLDNVNACLNVEDNNGSFWIILQKHSLRSESLTASTSCYWYHGIFIWGVLHPLLLLLPCSDTPLLIFLLVLLCHAVHQYYYIISFDYHTERCQLTHWISIWPHFVSIGCKIAEGPRTESIHHQAAASKQVYTTKLKDIIKLSYDC